MKNKTSLQYNILEEQNLPACVQAFKSKDFSIASSPYPAALGKWLDARKYGCYGLGSHTVVARSSLLQPPGGLGLYRQKL
eukprot:338723-Pelagomonas_calceolata.AAC.6